MGSLAKILIVLGLLATVIGVSVVGSVLSFNNDCVRQEASIKAQYLQNQNNYDNYFKTLKETAQVPSMYVEDLKKVFDGAMKGRYGAQGSRATFQFIKEHNPNFDASLYRNVQQTIEGGRKAFEVNQTTLLDKKRVYEQTLQQFPGTLIAGVLGFPKLKLDDYSIVTSEETDAAFKTKKAAPIKLTN